MQDVLCYCFLIVFLCAPILFQELRYLCALACAEPGAVITMGQMDQQKCRLFPLQGRLLAAICKLIIKTDL